ncbi:MAG TPA: FAD-dependent oxidoreductase, partial [Sandaracinaceae bacterium LLY-WYZ-13_1]|nr:FAD-dependent oxidoreductase [Sandaracinaceae bacterium LLY-WYZ-13_1]
VVEARDRVGGRTLSRRLGHDVIDLGGQWIGPTQRRVEKLAEALGVRTFPQHCEGRKVLAIGDAVKTYAGDIPSLSLPSLLELQLTLWRLDRLTRRVPRQAPWEARDAERLDALTLEAWKRRHLRTRGARAVLDIATRAIFAAEPEELSFLHFLFYLRSGGGLMRLSQIRDGAQERRFVGGAQQLSEMLAAPLGDALVLGSPVRALEQTEDRVIVRARKGDLEARRAILALAPALVDRIELRPAPPAMRDQLLQRMPMGSVIKCVAVYDRPFWRERGLSGEAVSDRGPVQLAFDDSSHDGTQHALVAFLLAGAARRAADGAPDTRRRQVLDALVRFFGPEAARPVEYVDHDWSAERFSGGCYVGLMPPGVLTTCGRVLREPCGRLHWAGTETATEHHGYLDGAIEAGERAADEVLDAL